MINGCTRSVSRASSIHVGCRLAPSNYDCIWTVMRLRAESGELPNDIDRDVDIPVEHTT